ncbi:hypothetical protein BaRGS_00014077 [Batillaria attramentaria]|uniref:Uncharacterized protein n=1 Tax=Batillaria attramentaria TaxID=370345 RepID=A0ABD0L6K9_9CAEN
MFRRQVSCSDQQLERCVEPLEQMQNPLGNGNLEDLDDEEGLNLVCNALGEAKSCISNYVSRCYSNHADIAVDTIEGVLGYICSDEGRDALLSETACWENQEVESRMNDCSERMQNRAFSLAMSGADQSAFCPLFDDLRRCIKQEIKSVCNSERASNFIDRVMYYALEPSVEEIGCDIKLRLSRKSRVTQTLPPPNSPIMFACTVCKGVLTST